MRIIAFGKIAELIGEDIAGNSFPDTDTLRTMLDEMYPALKQLNYQIAVNKEIVHTNTQISEDATIALLPPFSGG